MGIERQGQGHGRARGRIQGYVDWWGTEGMRVSRDDAPGFVSETKGAGYAILLNRKSRRDRFGQDNKFGLG